MKKSETLHKVKKTTIGFLNKNIGNLSDYLPLNEFSQIDLMQEVERLFVIPLSNAEADKEKINKLLLESADNVVDDLNRKDLDLDYFNLKIKEKRSEY